MTLHFNVFKKKPAYEYKCKEEDRERLINSCLELFRICKSRGIFNDDLNYSMLSKRSIKDLERLEYILKVYSLSNEVKK